MKTRENTKVSSETQNLFHSTGIVRFLRQINPFTLSSLNDKDNSFTKWNQHPNLTHECVGYSRAKRASKMSRFILPILLRQEWSDRDSIEKCHVFKHLGSMVKHISHSQWFIYWLKLGLCIHLRIVTAVHASLNDHGAAGYPSPGQKPGGLLASLLEAL